MTVDVVIPTTRPSVDLLIASLAQGSREPDRIWVVTNEVERRQTATWVNFSSDVQPIGSGDAGLRRNIGADLSDADIVLFLDDDCIAPANLVEEAARIAAEDGFCWGHHRYIDTDRHDLAELLTLPPEEGVSREHGVNRWHGWQSSYAGNLAIERKLFWEVGGFDLAYLGHHGSEDQQLGRRLSENGRTFVHEPPFAWHPDRVAWHSTMVTNTPGTHRMTTSMVRSHSFMVCDECPRRTPIDVAALTESETVVIPYSREQFTLKERI